MLTVLGKKHNTKKPWFLQHIRTRGFIRELWHLRPLVWSFSSIWYIIWVYFPSLPFAADEARQMFVQGD